MAMNDSKPRDIIGQGRWPSPVAAPQALAWTGDGLWVSSRDESRSASSSAKISRQADSNLVDKLSSSLPSPVQS